MKKVLGYLALAVLLLSSCEPVVTGEFLYTVKPADETSTGKSMSWQTDALGEALIISEMQKIGTPYNSAWGVKGDKKDCDKLVIDAVNKAMTAAENNKDYCSFFDFSGMTVVVYCNTDDKGNLGKTTTDFELYRRTYKTK